VWGAAGQGSIHEHEVLCDFRGTATTAAAFLRRAEVHLVVQRQKLTHSRKFETVPPNADRALTNLSRARPKRADLVLTGMPGGLHRLSYAPNSARAHKRAIRARSLFVLPQEQQSSLAVLSQVRTCVFLRPCRRGDCVPTLRWAIAASAHNSSWHFASKMLGRSVLVRSRGASGSRSWPRGRQLVCP
jgi:hypothetical protein